VSPRGNGGHWNRAGRRSGGARPVEIVMPFELMCAKCKATWAIGEMPQSRMEIEPGRVATICWCPNGCGVLWCKDPEIQRLMRASPPAEAGPE
jgi:hypothetical protein